MQPDFFRKIKYPSILMSVFDLGGNSLHWEDDSKSSGLEGDAAKLLQDRAKLTADYTTATNRLLKEFQEERDGTARGK